MKVKVGNKIYDGEKEPVMVILTDSDKIHIERMHPEAKKYCHFPDHVSEEEAKEFMRTDD